MLRRPPTILQLTPDDLTAYDNSRAQRLSRAAEERTRLKGQRKHLAQSHAEYQYRRAQTLDFPSQEGDTEPDSDTESQHKHPSQSTSDSDTYRPDDALSTRGAQGLNWERTASTLSPTRATGFMPRMRATSPPAEEAEDSDSSMADVDVDTPSNPTAAARAAAAARREKRRGLLPAHETRDGAGESSLPLPPRMEFRRPGNVPGYRDARDATTGGRAGQAPARRELSRSERIMGTNGAGDGAAASNTLGPGRSMAGSSRGGMR